MDAAELIPTEDGSLTCLDAHTGELYHNRAGAFTEALQNYFLPSDAAAVLLQHGCLLVLDVCFGLGYNSFVLLEQLLENGAAGSIEITAIECDAQILRTAEAVLADRRFSRLRPLMNGQLPLQFGRYSFSDGRLLVQLSLLEGDLRQLVPDLRDNFDLIFHDAFSPKNVPELWSLELFSHYYRLLDQRRGKLATYSSAGAVRGGLQAAGFHIYRTAAVGGKRGGTLAVANSDYEPAESVSPLTKQESTLLGGRSGVPYRDPTLKASRAEIFAGRQAELASGYRD